MSNLSNIEKINLKDYGFIQAGQCQGNPSNFKAALEYIYQGNVIDISIDEGINENERQNLLKSIQKLNHNIDQSKLKRDHLTEQEKGNVQKIKDLKEEISNIQSGISVQNKTHETFSSMKFFMNLIFLVPLSIYLFLFYVATIYKVFYFSPEQIAENSNGTISALPAPGEMSEALSYNYLLLFAPFLFFAFGYAIHVLLDLKTRWKYVYVLLVIAITFILDFLMAFKIHDNTSKAEQMISDTVPIELFSDANFYIILFMGFVVYIVWSVLLSALINEWKKRNVIGLRLNKIEDLQDDNEGIAKNLKDIDHEIAHMDAEIKSIEETISGQKLPINKLLFCLSELHLGWLQFLSAIPTFQNKIEECDTIYLNFLTENELN
jgi:peptidoglycan hydrolase CwlO-like protein